MILVMQLTNAEWTETEENIAKSAFEIAYKREINDLIDEDFCYFIFTD